MAYIFRVRTSSRTDLVDITSQVASAIREMNATDGAVIVFVPHTTCGITINENADPDVKRDISYKLGQVIPPNDGYHHMEGNSDAHIKASLMGSSVVVPIEDGKMLLGTWQGIILCEFDGPRTRKIVVKCL